MPSRNASYARLESKAKVAADFLYGAASNDQVIRIITHMDADGLCAGGILARAFCHLGISFHLSTVKYISRDLLASLKGEKYNNIVFLDLGAGCLGEVHRELVVEGGKSAVLLDHHPLQEGPLGGMIVVDPFLEGIDGDSEISGAGVSYLVYRHLVGDDEAVIMATTGALGDLQEVGGELRGMNSHLVQIAIEMEAIDVTKGLRLFGGPDYPLLSALQRTTGLLTSGVIADANSAVELLESISIAPKLDEKPVSISDLSEVQKRELTNEIVKRLAAKGRRGLAELDSLFGNIYLHSKEPKGSPTRDLNAFPTILNACGRMGRSEIGIALSMGLAGDNMEEALKILSEYRRELAEALSVISAGPQGGMVRKEGEVLFLTGSHRVRDTIIGTVTSIVANDETLGDSWIVVGLAESDHNTVKVSARLTASGKGRGIDLNRLVRESCTEVGGLGGGHKSAAGGQIPAGTVEEFIEATLRSLRDSKALQ